MAIYKLKEELEVALHGDTDPTDLTNLVGGVSYLTCHWSWVKSSRWQMEREEEVFGWCFMLKKEIILILFEGIKGFYKYKK